MPDLPETFAPRNWIAHSDEAAAEEFRNLLHDRLRACLIVLAGAYVAFLIQGSLVPSRRTVGILGRLVLGILLVAASVLLSDRAKPSLRRLRGIETLLFGGITLYTAFDLFLAMRRGVPDPDVDAWRLASFFKNDLAVMTALIFIYAVFIPNHWRRALGMILTMALAPLAAVGLLYVVMPDFRALVGSDPAMSLENLAEHVVVLATAVAGSVFGVRTINAYRTEAAREHAINQYRLKEKIGSGGMGEVYLAEHCLLKRPCALKFIAPKLTDSETPRRRFEREVRATAKLSHWNTVDVYDYGRTEDGRFFYVMEYLPGLSLQELVDVHGRLPASRVIYLLRQVCEALREAHLEGLIHRDLKPPNIFAAYRGARYDVAKVLDFGLVKLIADADAPMVTLEGIVTGSPLYMAPELVARDRIADGRADLYSLGAVAYFLLTGRPPFLGPDAVAVMLAHVSDEVEPPSRLEPSIPSDLEAVVLRCLAKVPEDRPADAGELGRLLASCRDAGGWSADQAEVWWREHQPIEPDSKTERPIDSEDFHGPTLVVRDFPGIDAPGEPDPDDPLLTRAEEPPPV
ncbi:serine/threonine-protein kinase [Paludisphaera rhizosphaerae]|uniref:serine/threonine-protein kinase n=1 Tax=Paludisphaera rhizosphaerae TaxID=2711216 RepID=UPI0013ED8D70|nr:serine/threonine-protein kinase [Paludisphaera rhizosphaerae]